MSNFRFVWSRLRPRFHLAGCRWAHRILPTNYVAGTVAESGDRDPCKVCHPLPREDHEHKQSFIEHAR
jgi:hypothetical protein